MISARKNVPWYDERFRGQGRDRIVQVLNMAGFVSFTVHPTVYVLQQPHLVAPSTLLAKASRQYKEVSSNSLLKCSTFHFPLFTFGRYRHRCCESLQIVEWSDEAMRSLKELF